MQEQNLAVHIPWTTGFGLGYALLPWLNLRVEPKWHAFELYPAETAQTMENHIARYQTFSLGLGLYGNYRPFGKKDNWLNGFMIVPSFRWWPRLSSSLENNELYFQNGDNEMLHRHEAMQIGTSNTPFFVNISIGYSYALGQ